MGVQASEQYHVAHSGVMEVRKALRNIKRHLAAPAAGNL